MLLVCRVLCILRETNIHVRFLIILQIEEKTHLVDVYGFRFDGLHPVSEIREILVRALALLGYEVVAFDTDGEPLRELERDAEKRSFWDFMKSHLFEKFVYAGDGY